MSNRQIGWIVAFLMMIGSKEIGAAGDDQNLFSPEHNSANLELSCDQLTEQEWADDADEADSGSSVSSTNGDELNRKARLEALLEVLFEDEAVIPNQTDRNETLGTQQPEKPYRCDECEYATSQKGHLDRHQRTHSGEKPYRCDECDYATSDRSNLNIHKRVHSGEKPYKCDECDYATSDRSNLNIHKRVHSGEKPYKCDQCDYATSGRGNLDRHKRIHSGEKPYKCDQCDYASAQRSALNAHKKKHVGGSQDLLSQTTSRTRGVHRFSPLE